jgi:hypothetical protein
MSTGHILLALLIGFVGGAGFMYLLRPYDNKSVWEMHKQNCKGCDK